jgi:stage V sporulation protein R
MSNKFIHGSPVLIGDNRVPGLEIPEELKKLIPNIFQECKSFGLDFYPTVVQMLTYDEISEIAAYGGFPVRYPHWKWGMEYEELQRGYMYGMHRIYEMVINSNPCYIYCLDSNTIVDNVTVIAHALGHNDFFKNNIFFSSTNQNMMNKLANHGTRIRKYMARWGREKVTEFIDHILRIETLIDYNDSWMPKTIKEKNIIDKRKYFYPNIVDVQDHDYMDSYINDKKWLDKQKAEIVEKEIIEELNIFTGKTKNIFAFIKDNAKLKPWQQDIASMLYEESMYFAPQRLTKMLNEGWASYIDYVIMCRKGLVTLGQKNEIPIVEYAAHKMGVLGGKYSTNPYKTGFSLFLDIEERWNKGRFGDEYEECDDLNKKNNWDQNLNLGKEKIFEVRKYYNDMTAIIDFFTPEFCEKYEFFNWEKMPNDDVKIKNRNYKEIKKNLINKYKNGGLPEIFLVDNNFRNKGYLMLEHNWDDKELYIPYLQAVMQSLYFLWGNNVYLETRTNNKEQVVYCCSGLNDDDFNLLNKNQI